MTTPPAPGTAVNADVRSIACRMNRRSAAARSPTDSCGREVGLAALDGTLLTHAVYRKDGLAQKCFT
jgi:hypothetical protein